MICCTKLVKSLKKKRKILKRFTFDEKSGDITNIESQLTGYSSAGCIIVGHNTIKGRVTDSQETFKKLYKIMKEAHDKGEKIFITIE